MESISPQQAADLRRLSDGLDDLDYFQVLQLATAATGGEIKKAFYRESRVYHPDRFFHLPDGDAKSDLNHLSKRITEAYYVLRDDAKRAKYLADIQGPERARKLRYTESTEAEMKAEAKQKVDEVFGTNPKARNFYKSALQDIERSNWSAAERNLKSAITFEPSNAQFKEKLIEVQQKAEADRKGAGDSYKIK